MSTRSPPTVRRNNVKPRIHKMSSEKPTSTASPNPHIPASENASSLEKHFLAANKAAIEASLAQYHDSELRLAKATHEAPTFSHPLTQRESQDSVQLWQIYNVVQKIDGVQQSIVAKCSGEFKQNLAGLNVVVLNFLGLLSTLNDERGDEEGGDGCAEEDGVVEGEEEREVVFAAGASHVAQIDVYCGELRQILSVTRKSLFEAERDGEEDWKEEPAGKLEVIRKSFRLLRAPRGALKRHRTVEWVEEHVAAAVEAGGEDWKTVTGDSAVLFRV
ncbi:hypothetical protein BDV97DRAFT_395008 [Delphinella strobiligena]|nr:hypothetical protein BDV97DRAFT_395008 [Delphinella strobiligena]